MFYALCTYQCSKFIFSSSPQDGRVYNRSSACARFIENTKMASLNCCNSVQRIVSFGIRWFRHFWLKCQQCPSAETAEAVACTWKGFSTGSVIAPWLTHFLYNLGQMLFTVSQEITLLVRVLISSKKWSASLLSLKEKTHAVSPQAWFSSFHLFKLQERNFYLSFFPPSCTIQSQKVLVFSAWMQINHLCGHS